MLSAVSCYRETGALLLATPKPQQQRGRGSEAYSILPNNSRPPQAASAPARTLTSSSAGRGRSSTFCLAPSMASEANGEGEGEGLPCPPVDPQTLRAGRPGRLRSSLLERLNTSLAADPHRFSSLSVEVDSSDPSRRRNSTSALCDGLETPPSHSPMRSRTFDVAESRGASASESWSACASEEEWLPDAPPSPEEQEAASATTNSDHISTEGDYHLELKASLSEGAYISPISAEDESNPCDEPVVPQDTLENASFDSAESSIEDSLTPVREPTKGRSVSFSYSESGAKLYQSIRQYYSLGSKNDNDLAVSSPEQSSSPVPGWKVVSDSSLIPEPSAGDDEPSYSAELSAFGESLTAESATPNDANAQENPPQSDDHDRSAEVYERYRTMWAKAASAVRVSKPAATAISFGGGRNSSASALPRKEKRTSTFDRLHGSYAHIMQKRERKRQELQQQRARQEVEETEVMWQLGDKSRELVAKHKRYAEGMRFGY